MGPITIAGRVNKVMLTPRSKSTASHVRPRSSEARMPVNTAVAKNGREHAFPIGSLAASLVASSRPSAAPYLFAARGKPDHPFNGWGKSKAALDRKSKVTYWTLHDLRRTFATKLAQLGVPPHVIERILNHVTGTLSPIALVYNRANYLSEMRAAMALYETHLTALFTRN